MDPALRLGPPVRDARDGLAARGLGGWLPHNCVPLPGLRGREVAVHERQGQKIRARGSGCRGLPFWGLCLCSVRQRTRLMRDATFTSVTTGGLH